MSFLRARLEDLALRIFRSERKLLAAGFPVVLGQGPDEPRIQPRMVFHWHPPFSMVAAEVTSVERSRFRAWLDRLISRRNRRR